MDVDSAVKYRGVHIGRVHSIGVAPDDRLIQVVLKIESDIQQDGNTKNLTAKLKSVGITGLMFIELEHSIQAAAVAQPQLSFKPPYPVIATRPSEISKFFQGIDDIFSMIRSIDAKAMSDQIIAALHKINRTIDDAQLSQLAGDLHSTVSNLQHILNTDKIDRLLASLEKTSNSFDRMAVNADSGITEIRKTVSRLDNVVASSGDDVQLMTTDLKAAAQEVRRAMESAAVLLKGTDSKVDTLQRQASTTLNRIEQATDTLNRFLDHLANQPSQVIFSAPATEKP